MDVTKTMSLPLKDVYQLLISEMRYGYRRNNHLMPGCGYEKVKRFIPEMYEVDKEYAVYTLKQLCEECITDQLTMNFYDGEDDDCSNRAEAIEFVKWSLDWIHEHDTDVHFDDYKWVPYCYDNFLANLAKDDEPRYLVYELRGESKRKKLLTPEPVSQKKYLDVILGDVTEATYRRETHRVTEKYGDNRRSYTYHIETPFKKDFFVKHI